MRRKETISRILGLVLACLVAGSAIGSLPTTVDGVPSNLSMAHAAQSFDSQPEYSYVQASATEIIIDMEREGSGLYPPIDTTPTPYWVWVHDHDVFHTRAYNGNFWYTLCGEEGHGDPLYYGEWTASLPQSGQYEVFVWIPNPDPFAEHWEPYREYTPTRSAKYEIYNGASHITTVTVNQRLRTGGWHELGEFYFSATAKIRLTDRTGEPYCSTMIAFDAVKFVLIDHPPDTSITSGPSGTIDYNDVTFHYTGSDDVTSTSSLVYSYKLEGYDSGWSSYTSSTSKSYNDLPNGSYTFRVRAKDGAGNVDPSSASRSFTVDVPPPDEAPNTSITSGPSGTIDYNDVTFHYTGSDDVTSTSSLVYSYKLEGYDSGWSSYTSSTSKSYNDLPNGSYTFRVRAKDGAGNVDPSPASRSFTVNPPSTPTSVACFDGQTCYSSKEEAISHVPDHVVPKECFVWDDGPPGHSWRVIPGYGCAHWVAHQLGIRTGAACYDGYSIRVRDVIAGRTEVGLQSCKVGDIWTNSDETHCGIVRQLGDSKVLVEHCSSAEGGVVTSWFSSGKCWAESPSPSPSCSSADPLPNSQLADLVRRHFPDGTVPQTGENIRVTAYAVARAESDGNPTACGDNGQSIGVWQIHMPSHPQYSREWLFDPENNAEAAREISNNGQDWNAWCTWEESACNGHGDERYRVYLNEARAALGISPTPILAKTETGFFYPTGKSGPYQYAGWLAKGCDEYICGYYHLGQDMEANGGDNVYAIADGVVTYISHGGWGEGNLGIVLRHELDTGQEFLSLYGHVRSSVSIGSYVTAGQPFATVGLYEDIPHLHFGIHPGTTMPTTNWGMMPIDRWPDTNGFVNPIEWITTTTWLIAEVHSPVEFRVYDSHGRVTGVVNGEVKEEIPNSGYYENTVIILSPYDSYSYDVTGTGEGSYELTVTNIAEQTTGFTLDNVPISSGAVHEYTIDWDTLSRDGQGVTMKIDSDGDGTFEQVINLPEMEEARPSIHFWVWVVLGVVAATVVAFMVGCRMSRKHRAKTSAEEPPDASGR